MRPLLNTLYVTQWDTYLAKQGETVIVKQNNKELCRLPIHNLQAIVHFGNQGVSPALLRLCAERNVSLSFCSGNGRFIARMVGPVSGNVLLRRKQYRMADNDADKLSITKSFLYGKVHNSRSVIQRAQRERGTKRKDDREMAISIDILRESGRKILQSNCLEELRGLEGAAAHRYFSHFPDFVLNSDSIFRFSGRNRRPPRDAVNAVLSFLYVLLANECCTALEANGLDPFVGFLHADRPGRRGLALDLMEELRPCLADRTALRLINRQQLSPASFEMREDGSVLLNDRGRKTVLEEWQGKKKEEIMHPLLKENIAIGLLPFIQAQLLARFIRGEMDAYPPFLIR